MHKEQGSLLCKFNMNNGITVANILPTDKDAGDMGFTEVNSILKKTKETDFSDIISQKLKGYDIHFRDTAYNQGFIYSMVRYVKIYWS